MKTCFRPADILLPAGEIDLTKWAVIACDQYTSQPEYWKKVEHLIGDAPSAYHIILPEVYLDERERRMTEIRRNMENDLSGGILQKAVSQGFVLTERQMVTGTRIGLIGAVDLEQYDYAADAPVPVRATEGTILSRIPPRVEIRRSSQVESPHIMMLAEDKEKRLTEPLYQKKESLRKLYDFELMLGGGHLRGYAVEGEDAVHTLDIIWQMQEDCGGVLLAVGDGNHSLAAAKAYWTEIKKNLTEHEKEGHPARYALAEVVNLYSEALRFEPIHRGVFGRSMAGLTAEFRRFLQEQHIETTEGEDFVFVEKGRTESMGLPGLNGRLPIDILQRFLNLCLKEKKVKKVDYIHGEENVRLLAQERDDFVGILTATIEKENLFPAIRAGGVLPRKTFSMGEAEEKRYYLECRALL